MQGPALDIKNLDACYGQRRVLHSINLRVEKGQLITLLGQSGAGRSSLLRAIVGLKVQRQGSIKVHGVETAHLSAEGVAKLGIGFSPEERGILAELSCEENLLLPPVLHTAPGGGMSLVEIYDMFPDLHDRKDLPGTQLSAGEQQMLAIARILRTGANLLLLDEVSGGVAPIVALALSRMMITLKERGYTIIIAEQELHFAAHLCDRFYRLEGGNLSDLFMGREANQLESVAAAIR